MKKMRLILILAFVIASNIVSAQNVLDGVYIKENTPNRKVIPYTFLREADVMWKKRIWRIVDLREKINHPMYYPTVAINNRKSLMQTIYDGITKDGTITPYDGYDDEFKKTLTKAEVLAMLNKVDTFQTENPETGALEQKIVPSEFDPAKVKQFRLKEEWFFDKQKSVMECRILGICPVMDEYASDGSFKGVKPLFWIYFPEARYVFANTDVFNKNNDSERRTLEDIFWKRQFGSYIYKESNVYDDRKISEYKQGIDALLEAEKIKEDIFNMEHDLWEF